MKTKRFVAGIMLAAGAAFGAGVFAADAPAMKKGDHYVNAEGMTLYTFDKDKANSGKSVCNDQCATNWPPLMADDSANASGDFSVITRDDGKKQWAYKGQPLYLFKKDEKPGDMKGDNVNDVWHVVK